MRWIEIEKSNFLTGNVEIPGSKNSSLALLTTCCLTDEPVILRNVPKISDVSVVCDIEGDIGVKIHKNNNSLKLIGEHINSSDINIQKSSFYRASYYFIGALLPRYKRVSLGYPGGDNIGHRPIDQHIKAFEAMGATFTFFNDYYVVEAEKLHPADIYFDAITSGATLNVMLAAVLTEGKTVLRNAARDPEIVDLAVLLNKMGANIKGAGTDTITIQGVDKLTGAEHSVIPDRLIAGSLLMCAGITGGNITVYNVIPEHLFPCTSKLEEAGISITTGDNFITAVSDGNVNGINVKTGMYPSFSSDYQQPITSMLIGASSHSTIIDTIYPDRFNHCIQLNRMGADIILRDGSVTIPGMKHLKGNWVHASDIRAGMCFILAGLNAEGVTRITGVEHIERGYENIVDTFKSLGAHIHMYEDSSITDDNIKNNFKISNLL